MQWSQVKKFDQVSRIHLAIYCNIVKIIQIIPENVTTNSSNPMGAVNEFVD